MKTALNRAVSSSRRKQSSQRANKTNYYNMYACPSRSGKTGYVPHKPNNLYAYMTKGSSKVLHRCGLIVYWSISLLVYWIIRVLNSQSLRTNEPLN